MTQGESRNDVLLPDASGSRRKRTRRCCGPPVSRGPVHGKRAVLAILLLAAAIRAGSLQATSLQGPRGPRIGIVVSRASYDNRWGVTQMSAHGWAAVANLAGIPYDCLFVSDLADPKAIARISILIFSQCAFVEDSLYGEMVRSLGRFIAGGGSVILDGPLALYNEKATDRNHGGLDSLLGVRFLGFRGNSNFRIKVANGSHWMSSPFEEGEWLTQHLANGLNILAFQDSSGAVLAFSDGRTEYPFLSCRETERGRMVLISDFSTWSGAASLFRNVEPNVFYANRLFPAVVRAVQWLAFGSSRSPIVSPRLSNAELAAVIRLDADGSGNLDMQIRTIRYLNEIAMESGVVPVYAWVSGQAARAGWQDLAPLTRQIEGTGGQIGTHSRDHRIGRDMDAEQWKDELDGSIRDIEFNTGDYDYPVGKVEWFINPGNTIGMHHYREIADRFSFYMTHGFEQDMPLGYGNLTWYTGPRKNLVVIEDSPSPDYQWFYDPSWSYTTAQITAYEEAIFDHLFSGIGHSVLFDQMWHDYSITSQPQHGKERIVNESNIAMYDGLRVKFSALPIYCPEPEDLGHKLRAMAQWDYYFVPDGNRLDVRIDLGNVRLDTIPHFTGGMGLAVENTEATIRRVTVNDRPHFAFRDRVVILPNLRKGMNSIRIDLDPYPDPGPRLTYVSKRMPWIEKKGEDLEVRILTRARARFEFKAGRGVILLNADEQEWDRQGDQALTGSVFSDRTLVLRKLKNSGWALRKCGFPVLSCEEKGSSMRLTLGCARGKDRTFRFSSSRKPGNALCDGKAVPVRPVDGDFELILPDFSGTQSIVMEFE